MTGKSGARRGLLWGGIASAIVLVLIVSLWFFPWLWDRSPADGLVTQGEPHLVHRDDGSAMWVAFNEQEEAVRGLDLEGTQLWSAYGVRHPGKNCAASSSRVLCLTEEGLTRLDLGSGSFRLVDIAGEYGLPAGVQVRDFALGADNSLLLLVAAQPFGEEAVLLSADGERLGSVELKLGDRRRPHPAQYVTHLTSTLHYVSSRGALLFGPDEEHFSLLDAATPGAGVTDVAGRVVGLAGGYAVANVSGEHQIVNLRGEVQAAGDAAGLLIGEDGIEPRGFFRVEGERVEVFDLELKSLWATQVPGAKVAEQEKEAQPEFFGYRPARHCGNMLLVPTGGETLALESDTGRLAWRSAGRQPKGCVAGKAVLAGERDAQLVDPANGGVERTLSVQAESVSERGILVNRGEGEWVVHR